EPIKTMGRRTGPIPPCTGRTRPRGNPSSFVTTVRGRTDPKRQRSERLFQRRPPVHGERVLPLTAQNRAASVSERWRRLLRARLRSAAHAVSGATARQGSRLRQTILYFLSSNLILMSLN